MYHTTNKLVKKSYLRNTKQTFLSKIDKEICNQKRYRILKIVLPIAAKTLNQFSRQNWYRMIGLEILFRSLYRISMYYFVWAAAGFLPCHSWVFGLTARVTNIRALDSFWDCLVSHQMSGNPFYVAWIIYYFPCC